MSAYWTWVKRTYNTVPGPARVAMHWGYFLFFAGALAAADAARGRNPLARHGGRGRRGMGVYYDVADWIGGWPFEPAAPEEVFQAFRDEGFHLELLKTCGGRHGCNEFVFSATGTKIGR